MEGKKVVMMSGLFIVIVILGQIQVGAAKICCPTTTTTAGCIVIVDDGNCPAGWPNDNVLRNTPSVGAVGLLCCPTSKATRSYKSCLAAGTPHTICLQQTGCTVSDSTRCPNRWTNEIHENTPSGQIQVVAAERSCCPNNAARYIYINCVSLGHSTSFCASSARCRIVAADGNCPDGWIKNILENTSSSVNEYCKLGCVSSVCGAITTLRHSDASEVVNRAVEKCTDACSTFCTRGVVETA